MKKLLCELTVVGCLTWLSAQACAQTDPQAIATNPPANPASAAAQPPPTTDLAPASAAPAEPPATDKAKAAAPAKPKAAKPKSASGTTFRGTLGAVDRTAMTLTIEGKKKHTCHVTSKTRFTKDGKPAMFSDATVGETVSVSVKKGKSGKYDAQTVRLGAKAEPAKKTTQPAKKPKATTATEPAKL